MKSALPVLAFGLLPPRRVKNQATASFIPAHLNPGVGASAGYSHLEATPAAGRDGPSGHKRPPGRHSQTAPRVAAPSVGPQPCCGPKQPARGVAYSISVIHSGPSGAVYSDARPWQNLATAPRPAAWAATRIRRLSWLVPRPNTGV